MRCLFDVLIVELFVFFVVMFLGRLYILIIVFSICIKYRIILVSFVVFFNFLF